MKHSLEKLKRVICPAAFKDLMVFHEYTTVCCPEWYDLDELKNTYPEKFNTPKGNSPLRVSEIEDSSNLLKNWNNKFHTDLRKSILDGDYRFCSKTCPHINKLYDNPELEYSYLESREEVEKKFGIDLDNPTPRLVYFNFDQSCNLKCPTCRTGAISNKDTANGPAQTLIESIERQLSPYVETLVITGSGDAFYTNTFREYLHNFDKNKYPKLKDIFLNTNGILWTPKMWEYVKAAHPYIKGTEWSVDAATKYTYENITRLNGKWDRLMENMDFVATQPNVKNLTFSFVVQEANYLEMVPFVELIMSKFKTKELLDVAGPDEQSASIMFRSLQHWGHQTKNWIKKRDIANPDHPKHKLLLEEIKKVHKYKFVESNLRHLVK